MSVPRAIVQGIESIPGVVTSDQMSEGEVQTVADALRATLRAVDDELLNRIASRCGRPPVSHPQPGAEGCLRAHPLVRQVLDHFDMAGLASRGTDAT